MTKQIKIVKAYRTNRVPTELSDEKITEDCHKDNCDINVLVARHRKIEDIDHVNHAASQFGFATAQTYQDAMFTVAKAQEMFMQQPAKVRKQFGNDPSAFLDFVSQPKNAKAMVEMGLATQTTQIGSGIPEMASAIAKEMEKQQEPTKEPAK